MDDFEIESDDDDQSSSFDGRASTSSYYKSSGPVLSKSIPSRSFFSGNNTDNYEDDYNFDFHAVPAAKKNTAEKGFNDKYLSKSSTDQKNVSSSSALEKAQSMLDKYSNNSGHPAASKKSEKSKKKSFTLKKPSDSFDEDDISLNSDGDSEIGFTDSKSGRIGSFEEAGSINHNGTYEGEKAAYGSPFLGSFNRDDEESNNGLQFFGRFDSVDQMNLHQKLYDYAGDDDEDRSLKTKRSISPVPVKSKAPPPVFVVADRSPTLTSFYPPGMLKSSMSDSFSGKLRPTQWGAEEDAGVILDRGSGSNKAMSEQINIEDSRDVIEKWEKDEDDDIRIESDDEEYHGIERSTESVDDVDDVQEYDRPKVASFADLGALTGWTVDPDPVETVTVTSSQAEDSLRGSTLSPIARIRGEDNDDDEGGRGGGQNDDNEDSSSEYSQEYEDELRDSDNEKEKQEKQKGKVVDSPPSKQKESEVERAPVTAGSTSTINIIDTKMIPVTIAQEADTTNKIEYSSTTVTPASASAAHQTPLAQPIPLNTIKSDIHGVVAGDATVHSVNSAFKRLDVDAEKEGATIASATITVTSTDMHTSHAHQSAIKAHTVSSPTSIPAPIQHGTEDPSKHPYPYLHPYLQGPEQRSLSPLHPMNRTHSTQPSAVPSQLQPEHTLSPLLASHHQIHHTHVSIPSFGPLTGHPNGSYASAFAPAPASTSTTQSQPEVPSHHTHSQVHRESHSEGFRYQDGRQYEGYPPHLQHPSYPPSHVSAMPVHPLQSSQQQYLHSSTPQHPAPVPSYGTGYPTPHTPYPYYPHPAHPHQSSSSLPYHPSMYQPPHTPTQQPYMTQQSEAADMYYLRASMPYHNTPQHPHPHPYAHLHPYSLSASTPGLGPTNAGFGLYPNTPTQPVSSMFPLRGELSMNSMRTNMNGMGGGNSSSGSGSGSGSGYGVYSGNLNGVSSILNEKSSNPGVEDLMRDLKEAKDDAVWAKARLSEMIALLNSSRDDWRASAALKVHENNSGEGRGVGSGPWISDSATHTPRKSAEGGLGKYQDKECKNISKYSDENRHEQEEGSKGGVSGGYLHDISVQGSEVDGISESVCEGKKEKSTRVITSADEDDNEYSLDFEDAPFKSGGGTDSERSMKVSKMEGVRGSVRARSLCSTRYSRNSDENSDGGSYSCDNSRKDDVSVGDVSVEKRVVTSSESSSSSLSNGGNTASSNVISSNSSQQDHKISNEKRRNDHDDKHSSNNNSSNSSSSSSSSSPDNNVNDICTAVNHNDDNGIKKMYHNSKNGDMNSSSGNRHVTENGGHSRYGDYNKNQNHREHGKNVNDSSSNHNNVCNNGNNNNNNSSSNNNKNSNNYSNNNNYSHANDSNFDRDRGKEHPPNMKLSSPSLFDMTSPLLNSQALFRHQLNNLRERMNHNTYNAQLYPTQGPQGGPLGGQVLRPSPLEVQRQFEGTSRTSSLQLWEVLKQVDSSLNEEEAKRLAERYTVIQ